MRDQVTAAELEAMLSDGKEIAVVDIREHGEYGEGHLFFCVSIPFSRFELDLPRLIPNPHTRVVMYNQDNGALMDRALAIAQKLGYTQVQSLRDGVEGWEAAGLRLFAGVNVPSKTFGEMIAENFHTPALSAEALAEKQANGGPVVVLDGRPWEEYHAQSIPGATSCPNGELVYRVHDLVEDEDTPIVINCAGRTRSILGCEMLRQYGIRNPVYALRNGTMGWRLSGREIDQGADRRAPAGLPQQPIEPLRAQALAMAEKAGASLIPAATVQQWLEQTERTTYLLDIRDPREFAQAHLSGARSAPGGQLIQATDEWVGVRRARLVLVDDTEVRAAACAYWLAQMDYEVYILEHGKAAWWATESGQTAAAGPKTAQRIGPSDLSERMASSMSPTVLDCQNGMTARQSHIPGSRWVIRPKLFEVVADCSAESPIVVVGSDNGKEDLIAADLIAAGFTETTVLEGGMAAWIEAGHPTEASPNDPPDEACIDYLFFVHDRHAGNLEAARRYLEWEHGLVPALSERDWAHYHLTPIRTD